MTNFDKRCAGLNNGTIRALPSQKSSEKSLADLLSAAGNWYEGLNNSLVNRYARSSEPLAKEVVAAWSAVKSDDEDSEPRTPPERPNILFINVE